MEFDKNGMLILENIIKTIKHEKDHDRLYEEFPPIKRKLSEKYASLLDFLHDYMENHVFVSMVMVSGLYITKYNPPHNFVNEQELKKAIKKRISKFLYVYKELGVCERYGKNIMKIDMNKLKKFSLNDIRGYCFKK